MIMWEKPGEREWWKEWQRMWSLWEGMGKNESKTRVGAGEVRQSAWILQLSPSPGLLPVLLSTWTHISLYSISFSPVKKITRGPKWPHLGQVTKLGLNSSLQFQPSPTKKVNLNLLVMNFLISTNEVICHMGPHTSPKADEIIHPIWSPAPSL